MSDCQNDNMVRLNLLIVQTENRIKLWEQAELQASRKYHRGLREIDRRGLTKPDNIFEATWEMVASEKLWVPEEKLCEDRALLERLVALRQQLEGVDGD